MIQQALGLSTLARSGGRSLERTGAIELRRPDRVIRQCYFPARYQWLRPIVLMSISLGERFAD